MPNFIIRGLQNVFGCTNPHVDDVVHAPRRNATYHPPAPVAAPLAAVVNAPIQVRAPAPIPAAVPAIAVNPTARYAPGRAYSIAELSQFASGNLPRIEDRPSFIREMASAVGRPNISQHDKAKLCKHLANVMQENDHVDFLGATRQANYFASYGIDITLQLIDQQYSAAMETDLRNLLSLWVNELCPSQAQFNMDGIIYTRSEVVAMLASPALITRSMNKPAIELGQRMDQRLRGIGSSSVGQTVHDRAVQENGSRVLNLIKAKHGQVTQLSPTQITAFLELEVTRNPFSVAEKRQLRGAIADCVNKTARDNNWQVNINPQAVLGHLCQYIQATGDEAMRNNLSLALLDRLREIKQEDPCTTGVLQRLLDVPSGIDPDMNFAGKERQIGEDVTGLAAKAYEQFSALIDEGIEAIPETERNNKAQKAETTTIGQNMFSARINQDLKRLGGLSETEIAPHRERLKAGFTS